MSRSRRKTPRWGFTTAESEKSCKVIAHRRYRHYADTLANEQDWDFINDRRIKENPYDYAKDGKTYWPEGIKDYRMMGK